MRTLMILCLLVAAGPARAETGAGNTQALAHGLTAVAGGTADATPVSGDEQGASEDDDEVAAVMAHFGGPGTYNHTWAIDSRIAGSGAGSSDTFLDGVARGECGLVIEITGDLTNVVTARLDVGEGGWAEDRFAWDVVNRTTGAGHACAVLIRTHAEISAAAAAGIGSAAVELGGRLDATVSATFSWCLPDGTRVSEVVDVEVE
jgi:hypothetical protein